MAKKSAKQSGKLVLPINNATIGADIEVFLRDSQSHEIISAEGIIKGAKDAPFKFLPGDDYFATSLDNVMAEFCIPPAKAAPEFSKHIQFALGWINGFVGSNLQTYAHPCAFVNPKFLQTENAKLFGCDPDYNAWTGGDVNPKPDATSGNLRSCGGHIHVGYDNPDMNVNMELIRAMDIFLGLPSVIQEPDNERKTLYGKAGAFRHKAYGVEYRTISNYYITDSKLMEWAFNNTHAAIDFVNNRYLLGRDEGEGVIFAINNNDKKLAETLINYFGVKMAA